MMRKSVAALTAAAMTFGSVPCAYAAPKAKPPTEEQVQAYLADKPTPAQPLFRHAMVDGSRNEVLYLMRAGLASMDADDFKAAAAAFDQALDRIEAVYANNPSADKARSKFVKEAVKDFKGEGYERSMAYYYRGVLYLYEGDYDNARASFMSSQLQDQWAEDQQYASDFALVDVLAGWASQCAGDPGLAKDFYDKARAKNPTIAIPAADDRVLLLTELGHSPQKWADGKYQEALHYRTGDTSGPAMAVFRMADAELMGRSGESLFRQASTRGGREVDTILAGKASFKTGAEGLSQGMSQAALYSIQNANSMSAGGNYSGANTMAYAGLAMAGIGLLSAAAASAAKPQADIRYWDNLPETLVIVTAPKLGRFGQLEYLDAGGQPVATTLVRPRPDPRGACSISWSRQSAAYRVPDIAPNSELTKK